MLGHRVASLQDLPVNAPLEGRYVVVGVPDERGVAANKGNLGAAQGPAAFRDAFYKLYDTPLREFCERTHRPFAPHEKPVGGVKRYVGDILVDAGDVALAPSVEATHEALASVVEGVLRRGAKRVFVVGGGHDYSYGSYLGHSRAKQGLLPIVNLDAHLDVRPLVDGVINSGTPFRRVIDNLPERIGGGRALLELGIQRDRNPDSLYDYAAEHRVPVIEFLSLLHVWRRVFDGKECSPLNHVLDHLDDCRALGWERHTGGVHLSIDLDVFHANLAPGTSASTPFGVSLAHLGPVLSYLGRVPQCAVVDLAELCPPRDVAGQTARLAAGLVQRLLLVREEYASDVPGA